MAVSNEISDKDLGMLVVVTVGMLTVLAVAIFVMWTTVFPTYP